MMQQELSTRANSPLSTTDQSANWLTFFNLMVLRNDLVLLDIFPGLYRRIICFVLTFLSSQNLQGFIACRINIILHHNSFLHQHIQLHHSIFCNYNCLRSFGTLTSKPVTQLRTLRTIRELPDAACFKP